MAVMLLTQCTADNMLELMDEERKAATSAFPGTENNVYWTSTEWTELGAAVYVDFRDGSVNADDFSKDPQNFVRCVANVDAGGTPSKDAQEFHSVYFPIAATGQVKSYAEGDDGYHKDMLPTQAFVNNHDGTVTDAVTGLVWLRCSLGESGLPDNTEICKNVHVKYKWADAVNACLNLEYAGRNDWFLPTFSELTSLVDYGRANPAIK